jgi:hypothetical protein
MKIARFAFSVFLIVILTACSDSTFEGKFTAAAGTHEFHFKPDGYVTQAIFGNEVAEYRFEKDGNKIRVYTTDNDAQTFTLKEDGSLVGPGGKLTPVKSEANIVDIPEPEKVRLAETTYKCGDAYLHFTNDEKGYVENPENGERLNFEYEITGSSVNVELEGDTISFTIKDGSLVGERDSDTCTKT